MRELLGQVQRDSQVIVVIVDMMIIVLVVAAAILRIREYRKP